MSTQIEYVRVERLMDDATARRPDHPALIYGERRWTYGQLREEMDRRALRINVGGLKVAPEEVEAVLAQHPAVREVVALAMPDAARGEVVRVVIVPEGAPPSVGALRRYCRERLAGYKVPRRWEFRNDLPRSPLGKVPRHDL